MMFWSKRLKPDDPAKREELQNEIQRQGGLEKHDLLAMVLAALGILLPVCLALLIVICLIAGLPIWLG